MRVWNFRRSGLKSYSRRQNFSLWGVLPTNDGFALYKLLLTVLFSYYSTYTYTCTLAMCAPNRVTRITSCFPTHTSMPYTFVFYPFWYSHTLLSVFHCSSSGPLYIRFTFYNFVIRLSLLPQKDTSNLAVAERPCDASCPSVQLQ